MYSLSGLSVIFYFIIQPMVVLFAQASITPGWFNKEARTIRDFQYLIHGVILSKMLIIIIDIVNAIQFSVYGYDESYCSHVEAIQVFAFNSSIMLVGWYSYLFRIQLQTSTLTGLKRLKWHFICITVTLGIGMIDSTLGHKYMRMYTSEKCYQNIDL